MYGGLGKKRKKGRSKIAENPVALWGGERGRKKS